MTDKTLSELRKMKAAWIQDAVVKELPQKLIKVASLGDTYRSRFWGLFEIFPVYYGSQVAIVVHREALGELKTPGGWNGFENTAEWQKLDHISVFISDGWDPSDLDHHSNLPKFWNGLRAFDFTLIDGIEYLNDNSNLYVPGDWIKKALQYVEESASNAETKINDRQEQERVELQKQLLIGEKI